MKIINKQLVDLTGASIKSGDLDLTVAQVLTAAALAPSADPSVPRKPADVAARYALAITLHQLKVDDEFELAVALAVPLRDDMLRIYQTIVAGQMLPILEGNAA